MKKLFNWILVLGACVAAFYLIGLIVPRSQAHTSKTNLQAKPAEVYALVSDLAGWRTWHPEVASIQQRPERNDHPIWQVMDKHGDTYELEVTVLEEDRSCQVVYTLDGTRTTQRFDLAWYGEGCRLRVTCSTDTRDPWLRARRFLLPSSDVSSLTLLNAVATQLGESAQAEEE